MDRDEVVDYLTGLPTEQFVDVLRRVFARKQPAPEESAYCRNKYYLGTASSDQLESDNDEEPPRWGPWEHDVVAYPDPQAWGDSLGPDYGLAQVGSCGTCGVRVRSNVKQGLCPICGGKVYMT